MWLVPKILLRIGPAVGGVSASAGEILYLITPNNPFSNSCFIVDVSWHVNILDKAGCCCGYPHRGMD